MSVQAATLHVGSRRTGFSCTSCRSRLSCGPCHSHRNVRAFRVMGAGLRPAEGTSPSPACMKARKGATDTAARRTRTAAGTMRTDVGGSVSGTGDGRRAWGGSSCLCPLRLPVKPLLPGGGGTNMLLSAGGADAGTPEQRCVTQMLQHVQARQRGPPLPLLSPKARELSPRAGSLG